MSASHEALRADLREAERTYSASSASSAVSDKDWPEPLGEVAYHGLAGEFLRLVQPHSEADPAATLVQLLAGVGSAVGHGPHVTIEGDRHGTNLYVILVGSTSAGRKGTSLGRVRTLARMADPSWGSREVANLGSGEVVIWETRDSMEKVNGETDPGVSDKRLFVVESEFSGVLRVAGRSGSILSSILRQAWDTGELRHTVKTAPARSTGAHVSIVGHITPEELRRELSETDKANGLANRFLWVASKRSKMLPRGGSLRTADLEPLARRLSTVIDYAKTINEAEPDGGFWEVWDRVYEGLTAERPGMLGAILGRAAPQVRRLSLCYAVLDCSPVVSRLHLEAALEVWRYCQDSAAWIFGDSLGDPTADEILRALRRAPDGLDRRDLDRMFSGHRGSNEISRAVAVLVNHGLAVEEKVATGGAPRVVLREVRKKRKKRNKGQEAES